MIDCDEDRSSIHTRLGGTRHCFGSVERVERFLAGLLEGRQAGSLTYEIR